MPASGRTLHVVYRCADGRWHASSPDVRRLHEEGETLDEVRATVRQALRSWLRPGIVVEEQVV